MPLVGITVDGVNYKFEEALKGIPSIPHPIVYAVVETIRRREAERSPDEVSVTELTGCPRAKVIKILDEYYLDFDSLMSAFRGTVVHEVLAKYAASNAIVETRASREYRGYVLYGTPDSVVLRNSGRYHLVDFKTTKRVPSYGPWSNHTVQINIYRWLLGLPVNETDMDVVYISFDDARIVPKRVTNVWEDRDVEEYLDRKFIPLAQLVERRVVVPVSSVPSDVLSWACSYCNVVKECITRAKQEGEAHMAQLIGAVAKVSGG